MVGGEKRRGKKRGGEGFFLHKLEWGERNVSLSLKRKGKKGHVVPCILDSPRSSGPFPLVKGEGKGGGKEENCNSLQQSVNFLAAPRAQPERRRRKGRKKAHKSSDSLHWGFF